MALYSGLPVPVKDSAATAKGLSRYQAVCGTGNLPVAPSVAREFRFPPSCRFGEEQQAMAKHRLTSKRIFFGWWVVAVSMIGISAGPAPFIISSLGVFMNPLTSEFGWSRAEVSSCLMIITITAALCFPLIGRLIDRFGSRTVLLPSMVVFALCLSAIPTVVSEYWHYVVVFLVVGTLGAATNTISYVPVVSTWFDKRRGLALGIAASGIGLGFMYVPVLVQFMISNFGWRSGYFALSGIIIFVAMPLVWMGMKASPASMGLKPDGVEGGAVPDDAYRAVGLTPAEVLRTRMFWLLVLIFIVMSFVLNGLVTHIVPMLTDRNVLASTAALTATTAGAAVFISRIVVGMLVDRFFAPHVAIVAFSLSAIGFAIFASGASGPITFLAAATIGVSLGAEVDLLAYLTSRYFGLRYCGSNYGLLLAAVLLGGGLGPVAFGAWFDTAGSYVGLLQLCVVGNVIAIIVTVLLKPYPDWRHAVSSLRTA